MVREIDEGEEREQERINQSRSSVVTVEKVTLKMPLYLSLVVPLPTIFFFFFEFMDRAVSEELE